jgi:hypothetical protein
MPKLTAVKELVIKPDVKLETSPLYVFSTSRYPTAYDADRDGYVFAYKPQGWPEVLQPQYLNAPTHILARAGYWSRMKVKHLQSMTYDHPDWRRRLHFTHWKPISKEHDGYVFDPHEDLHPSVPGGLDWDTYDWSHIKDLVAQARNLIIQGVAADRSEVHKVHEKLKQSLDSDDVFYLNQWLYFCRKLIREQAS